MATPDDPAARLAASSINLPAAFQGTFRRFGRELLAQAGTASWRLFIGEYEHTQEREQVAQAIEALLPGSQRVTADTAHHADWAALEATLVGAAVSARGAVLQVFGLENWLNPLDREATARKLRAANLRREALACAAPVAMVFWLREAQVRDWVAHAPDLWAWRSGVHEFQSAEPEPRVSVDIPRPFLPLGDIDNRSSEERRTREAVLRSFLETSSQQPDSRLRVELYDEWADLLRSLGDVAGALSIRQGILAAMCQRLGDSRESAINRSKVASILQSQGHLQEALRIQEQEVLPVLNAAGDRRGVGLCKGYIADLYLALGDVSKALQIRRDEQIPILSSLGDKRSLGIAQAHIADIHLLMGDIDAAMLILTEVVSVFEAEQDLRSIASVKSRIADVLMHRGRFDDSLRIRQEEILPVVKYLGDQREIAAAWFGIAATKTLRGDAVTDEGRAEIERLLEDAFAVVTRLGSADGIVAVGEVLVKFLNQYGSAVRAGLVQASVNRARTQLGRTLGFEIEFRHGPAISLAHQNAPAVPK